MNPTLKSIVAAGLATAIGAAALPAAANAGGSWNHNNNGGWNHYNNGGWYHHDNGGAAIAAGVIGFATGAIVGSALTPRYYAPQPYAQQPYYAAPKPYAYQPKPVYYGAPAAWTPAWYSYCASKYRSFNSKTGYFYGYDGQYHFCR
jgi:BA14K-like protein